MRIVDLTDVEMEIDVPLARVVSLVPAVTETIFALGGGDALVGRTRYCIAPMPLVKRIPHLGGTKDPDLQRIVELRPDIVLANREENRKEDVESLRRARLTVHVDEPRTPDQALEAVALYATLLDRVEEGLRIVYEGEQALYTIRAEGEERECADKLRLNPRRKPKVACLVWRHPWMAVGRDTYAGSLIETLGGINVFGDAPQRYFELSLEDLGRAAPDILLLPGEPYPFKEKHADEIRQRLPMLPAAQGRRVRLCDGQDLTWFGARTPGALLRLRPMLAW